MNKFQLLINSFTDDEISSIRTQMINSGKPDNAAWNKTLRHLIGDIDYIQQQRATEGLKQLSLIY